MGRDLWWHRRLPEAGHSFATAVLQQAQWLELELDALKRERSAQMEGTEKHER